MAKYPNIMLTNAGLNMIAESQGSGQLIFTSIKLGDGSLAVGEDIKTLTDLKNPLLTANISSIDDKTISGQVSLTAVVNNTNVTTGFFARELGVYAKVGSDGTEKLYAYTNAGNYGDYMPDKNTPIDENKIKVTFVVGNAANVTAIIDSSIIYTTIEDVNAAIAAHNIAKNAHADLLHLRKNSTVYAVGDIAYSPNLPSFASLECTIAGTTAASEPTWPTVGQTVVDGTVTWIVRDSRVANDSSDNSAKLSTTSWIKSNIQSLVSGCIATVATAAGFACSLNTNGYIKLPSWLGGLIIQWSRAENVAPSTYASITFPITFTTAITAVAVTPITSTSTPHTGIDNYKSTGCRLYNYNTSAQSFVVMALGY